MLGSAGTLTAMTSAQPHDARAGEPPPKRVNVLSLYARRPCRPRTDAHIVQHDHPSPSVTAGGTMRAWRLFISTRGTVVEVKDVARLTSSPQLRDLVQYAQSLEVPLEIFTNAQLPQSGQLAGWIERGVVTIRPLP